MRPMPRHVAQAIHSVTVPIRTSPWESGGNSAILSSATPPRPWQEMHVCQVSDMLGPAEIERIVVAVIPLVVDRAHGVPAVDCPEELCPLLGDASVAGLTSFLCPVPEECLQDDSPSVREVRPVRP